MRESRIANLVSRILVTNVNARRKETAVIAAARKFHFIGICGTAMGSVAAALRERDFIVTGSDESVYPPMSTFLEGKGIALHSGYRPENIPDDADVIVIGNVMK